MIALEQRALSYIADDVAEGLRQTPKSLPPKLFYDAQGSELFERITELPEYYLTRTETRILSSRAEEIARLTQPRSVVELGAGSAKKTLLLLRRMKGAAYWPVDVSWTAVEAARAQLRRELPELEVQPVIADFLQNLRFLRNLPQPRLLLYIGSSIGNLDPPQAVELLRSIHRQLSTGDFFLLGTDLVKRASTLRRAYDDAQGVTAAFNKNILQRINRELGGHFDIAKFRHLARWDRRQSRIEMHLQSTKEQTVSIDALDMRVHFAEGETIHTENSYKYRVSGVRRALREWGLAPLRTWTDAGAGYAVHLAQAV